MDPRVVGTFHLGSGERGCLLLHGFTGTPHEVRPIGEALAANGWQAIGPLLPGHGTDVEDLAATGWEDWFAAALDAWDELGHTSRVRTCAGLSMGALLALHLAHERPREVAALALLAPALRLRNQRGAEHALWLSRIPFLPRRLRIVPKHDVDERARRTPAYDHVPVGALASMIHLQRRVAEELAAIETPALLLEGALDPTIDPEIGETIAAALGAATVRRRVFARSGHILTEDPDAPEVLDEIVGFFADAADGGFARP